MDASIEPVDGVSLFNTEHPIYTRTLIGVGEMPRVPAEVWAGMKILRPAFNTAIIDRNPKLFVLNPGLCKLAHRMVLKAQRRLFKRAMRRQHRRFNGSPIRRD